MQPYPSPIACWTFLNRAKEAIKNSLDANVWADTIQEVGGTYDAYILANSDFPYLTANSVIDGDHAFLEDFWTTASNVLSPASDILQMGIEGTRVVISYLQHRVIKFPGTDPSPYISITDGKAGYGVDPDAATAKSDSLAEYANSSSATYNGRWSRIGEYSGTYEAELSHEEVVITANYLNANNVATEVDFYNFQSNSLSKSLTEEYGATITRTVEQYDLDKVPKFYIYQKLKDCVNTSTTSSTVTLGDSGLAAPSWPSTPSAGPPYKSYFRGYYLDHANSYFIVKYDYFYNDTQVAPWLP